MRIPLVKEHPRPPPSRRAEIVLPATRAAVDSPVGAAKRNVMWSWTRERVASPGVTGTTAEAAAEAGSLAPREHGPEFAAALSETPPLAHPERKL
jgi:hypothetical protein